MLVCQKLRSTLTIVNCNEHDSHKEVYNMNQISGPRELTADEIDQVSGGILPVIAVVLSFATHHAVRTVGQYFISRTLTIIATYETAKFVDGVLGD